MCPNRPSRDLCGDLTSIHKLGMGRPEAASDRALIENHALVRKTANPANSPPTSGKTHQMSPSTPARWAAYVHAVHRTAQVTKVTKITTYEFCDSGGPMCLINACSRRQRLTASRMEICDGGHIWSTTAGNSQKLNSLKLRILSSFENKRKLPLFHNADRYRPPEQLPEPQNRTRRSRVR
jgi:hypothetical protein